MVRGRVRRDWRAEHRIVRLFSLFREGLPKICEPLLVSPNNISFSFSSRSRRFAARYSPSFLNRVFNQRDAVVTANTKNCATTPSTNGACRFGTSAWSSRFSAWSGFTSSWCSGSVKGSAPPNLFCAFVLLLCVRVRRRRLRRPRRAGRRRRRRDYKGASFLSPPVTTVFPSPFFPSRRSLLPSLSSSVPSVRRRHPRLFSRRRPLAAFFFVQLIQSFPSPSSLPSLRVSVAPLLARSSPPFLLLFFVVFFPSSSSFDKDVFSFLLS